MCRLRYCEKQTIAYERMVLLPVQHLDLQLFRRVQSLSCTEIEGTAFGVVNVTKFTSFEVRLNVILANREGCKKMFRIFK